MDLAVETAMIIIFVILVHLLILYYVTRKKKNIKGKHVVVTGGSSGIGLQLAINAAKLGADVTIIARNIFNLEQAVTEIKKHKVIDDQKVEYKSLDLAKADYTEIERVFEDIEEKLGDIYMLVNCAGMAICGTIEEMKPEDVKYLMQLNYYGTYFPIKYVLPKMKARKDGIIVLTGSQASLLGIYGLGAYSAAKFALRGLAEALSMETKHLNITVTLALPTDTNTPGFDNEQKSKPIETKLICGSGGLATPELVAKGIMKDALLGSFFSIQGLASWIMSVLCVGMSPWKNPVLAAMQFYLMGPLRLIGIVLQWSFGRIIKKCYDAETKDKKTN